MNKTQKGAWFSLGIAVLLLVFIIIIFIGMFSFLAEADAAKLARVWSLMILFFMGVSVIFIRKKQSPAEVESDERDSLIKKRAVLVSFVSIWILLIASSIIPEFIVGDTGSIPVCLLPIINLSIFLIAMFIYSVAVLVQYGRGGKDGRQ